MDLREELALARKQRDELDVVIGYLEGRLDGQGARRPRSRRAPSTGRVTAAQAAEKVLGRAGAPMKTSELLAEVRKGGAQVGNGETLAKALTRSPAFKKAGRGMWTLV